ncbi:MAG: hypothetical protein EXR14_01355 [Pelagibacteraceae bacterium]|nr:hypothetical protein [Pelagibacteraceae bacterium]PHX89095.1 MAG: hypothetical protein CK535_03585 [Pelagibacteraceae bacterium]
MQLILKSIFIIFFSLCFSSNSFCEEIFYSLKKNKVNVRYGPGFEFEVKYVYNKKNLPVKEIDKKENFRRIIDLKNNSGWIHSSQLQRSNSIIATQDKILFKKPSKFSKPIAQIKKGRLLIVQKCENNWCKIKSEDFDGWVNTTDIWGSVNN